METIAGQYSAAGAPVATANTDLPIQVDAQGNLKMVSTGTNAAGGTNYETVAASQTNQAMGATGAVGDYLRGVLIVPSSTTPGIVQIKDGSNSAITIFVGGASSITALTPFFVSIGANSVSGAWQVTTGANVTAIGVGSFT